MTRPYMADGAELDEKPKRAIVDVHADEITQIIAESQARVDDRKLEGQELLAERRACSKLIGKACERHRAELNAPEKDAAP